MSGQSVTTPTDNKILEDHPTFISTILKDAHSSLMTAIGTSVQSFWIASILTLWLSSYLVH